MPAQQSKPSPSLNLLVPVAVWPSPPKRHEVTSVCVTAQARSAVLTGCSTGQLCIWSAEEAASSDGHASEGQSADRLRLSPRVLLLGHTSPVVWTAPCLFDRSDAFVSLCAGGVLNVWDPMDGRCLSSVAAPLLPVASVGALLPQRTHAVVGGEAQALVIVQLSSMTVRRRRRRRRRRRTAGSPRPIRPTGVATHPLSHAATTAPSDARVLLLAAGALRDLAPR
jgi:hypothetical protein